MLKGVFFFSWCVTWHAVSDSICHQFPASAPSLFPKASPRRFSNCRPSVRMQASFPSFLSLHFGLATVTTNPQPPSMTILWFAPTLTEDAEGSIAERFCHRAAFVAACACCF